MNDPKWLGLTEAAHLSGVSPHTLRKLANHSEGGKHMPKIPHVRVGAVGRQADDGRRGEILIDSQTCRALRAATI